MADTVNTELNKTTDWQFDFSTLPRWNNRNIVPFVYDKFHHLPKSDTLCCIYSIAEVGMGRYQGFLAILKNKEHPELLLNFADNMCFCDNFSASKNENIVFLQIVFYDKAKESMRGAILILDIAHQKFAHYDSDNCNPSYKIVELNDHLFGIEADEKQKENDERLNALSKQKIDLHTLKWYDFSKLNSLPEKVIKKKRTLNFIAFVFCSAAVALGLAYELWPRLFPDWLFYTMSITGFVLLIALIVALFVEKKRKKK